jgi:hypothetical protein
MNTKTPESWQSDTNAHDVQIEISAERSLILPFGHFMFADLTSDGKQQSLRLVFVSHEIVIRGYALRRITTAIQRRELSFLAKSASRKNITEGQPVVMEISAKETQESGKAEFPEKHEYFRPGDPTLS